MKVLYKILLITFYLAAITFGYAQRRVACIGDSVTKGYGLKDSSDSYPSQLQQLLGKGFVVSNFGHSGATLLEKGHNPYIKTNAYQEALKFNPDIVIIALGLNDTDPRNWPNYKNEFIGDYSRLIQSFKSLNPNVEVFVCYLTPIFSGHRRFLSGTRAWFDQIQELIPQIAKANDATLIDNFEPLSPRIDLFDDYLHPNKKGAKIIADNVVKHLQPIKQPLSVHESIGSHMVLQRNVANKISGQSSANAKVELSLGKERYSTTVTATGEWSILLPSKRAGGPYDVVIQVDNEKLILKDILFGDVFLSSGQSNMAFPLRSALRAEDLIRNAEKFTQVRLFKNKNLAETSPVSWDSLTLEKVNDLAYFTGQWELPNAKNVSSFSAIAYAAALDLHLSERIPIGIIDVSVGGSNLESWISRRTLEQDDLLATYIHQWKTADFIQDFCRERGAKNIANSKIKNQRHPYEPAYNYEAGIRKWLNTSIKGIWWYQGESNAHNAEHHAYLFKKFVHSWRESFKQEIPFYVVQLSSLNRPSWPDFRNSQRLLTTEIPQVYMAISSDTGDSTDVHPKEKILIGKRIANLTRQHQYGNPIQADAPQPIKIEQNKDKLTIVFSNCKSLKTKNKEAIQGFQLVDNKGNIHTAQILANKNNRIDIQAIEGMTKVQYAYEPFTKANLESDTDVPVSTFSMSLD